MSDDKPATSLSSSPVFGVGEPAIQSSDKATGMTCIGRALLVFDLLVLMLLCYFFTDGLQYAPQLSYFTVWIPLLLVPVVLITGAVVLAASGRTRLATAILALLAGPPLAYIGFFGLLIILNPKWN